ncbi:hypothetical protein DSLASN_00040 [Desulfoluna limicola]|uniref:Uncharacterized protein n=1 Tax=Desulfoluna limicola TaxID=2810562 RepID=A0ABN6EZ52_9BACT|nr:hypothetical protein DSLASN_00040 [Desulfoluna limicola]
MRPTGVLANSYRTVLLTPHLIVRDRGNLLLNLIFGHGRSPSTTGFHLTGREVKSFATLEAETQPRLKNLGRVEDPLGIKEFFDASH